MYRYDPRAPLWRRALLLAWRGIRLVFKVFFMLLLLIIPIPIGLTTYRPHRDRKNQVTQVLKKGD